MVFPMSDIIQTMSDIIKIISDIVFAIFDVAFLSKDFSENQSYSPCSSSAQTGVETQEFSYYMAWEISGLQFCKSVMRTFSFEQAFEYSRAALQSEQVG